MISHGHKCGPGIRNLGVRSFPPSPLAVVGMVAVVVAVGVAVVAVVVVGERGGEAVEKWRRWWNHTGWLKICMS